MEAIYYFIQSSPWRGYGFDLASLEKWEPHFLPPWPKHPFSFPAYLGKQQNSHEKIIDKLLGWWNDDVSNIVSEKEKLWREW